MNDEQAEARFDPSALVGGRYELTERLGELGLGEIWRARDPNLPTRVFTVELLGPAAGEEIPAALSEHLHVLRTLHHAGIVPTTGRGVWGGRVYVVMGPLDGVSLSRYVTDRRAPLGLTEVDAIVQQIGAALAAAHRLSARVAHGDLHPEVVVVSRADDARLTARVMDFGLAAFLDARALAQVRDFVAPERRSSPRPTPAMDVFSLGRVLRWLLEGASGAVPAKPHVGGLRGREDVPDAVWRLIEKATSASPEERHTSVLAMLAELKEAWKSPVGVNEAPPREVPARVGEEPPRLFEEARLGGEPVVPWAMPSLPLPPEAHQGDARPTGSTPAPAENPWGTALLQRKVAVPEGFRGEAEPPAENPWSTNVLRRPADVPENLTGPVGVVADALWGSTVVVPVPSLDDARPSPANSPVVASVAPPLVILATSRDQDWPAPKVATERPATPRAARGADAPRRWGRIVGAIVVVILALAILVALTRGT